MTDTEFLHVKLSGGRFNDEIPPLHVFENLIDLQKLVIKTAKQSYKKQHGQLDARSKSNFDSTYFSILQLEKGSTVVRLDLSIDKSVLDVGTVPNENHLDKASKTVVDIIKSGDQVASRVNGLSGTYKSYFENVKKKLKPGEALEITTANKQTARLTSEICDMLLEHLSVYTTRNTKIEGIVSEVDRKYTHFRLDMIQGGAVSCPINNDYLDIIIDALGHYKKQHNYEVIVHAICKYDHMQKLKKVDSVMSIMPSGTTDTEIRLEEFRSIRDGWLPEGGKAPSHEGLAWLKNVFKQYYPKDLPQPYTYPTPDGGVSLEWSTSVWDVDIEIDLEKHVGQLFVFNKNTRQGEDEKSLKLDNLTEWEWVAKQLRNLME